MKSENYTLLIICAIISSAGFGSLVTWIFNRGHTKAQTENLIGKTYGELLDDLRNQVKYQGDQIQALQARELEYLKIINGHQETERELRKQITALETKLNKRFNNLERANNSL
jgi:hypothetical protein